MRDCKLAAIEAEARTAKALALKAAKAVETIEITDIEGITAAQTYRSNLWPSVSPSIKPALDAAQRGERLVVSEETKRVRRTAQNAHVKLTDAQRSHLDELLRDRPQWFKEKILADIAVEERRDDEDDTPRPA